MRKDLVSILIVSYNAEKYIEKTLRSCLAQTYPALEILVLDNASNDRTVEITRNLSNPRITLFEGKENIGPYAGLNFLLEKANGEYVAIQDHDDIWLPEKLMKQVEFLENSSEFVACGTNTFYFYESKNILILNGKPAITDFVDHTSLMFRNKGFRYNEGHHFSDDHFEKKVLPVCAGIACIEEGLVVHRIKSDGSNFSSYRFKLTSGHIVDFFDVFGFRLRSFTVLADILISRYLSDRIVWFIRKNLTQRKKRWVLLAEFQKENPEVTL